MGVRACTSRSHLAGSRLVFNCDGAYFAFAPKPRREQSRIAGISAISGPSTRKARYETPCISWLVLTVWRDPLIHIRATSWQVLSSALLLACAGRNGEEAKPSGDKHPIEDVLDERRREGVERWPIPLLGPGTQRLQPLRAMTFLAQSSLDSGTCPPPLLPSRRSSKRLAESIVATGKRQRVLGRQRSLLLNTSLANTPPCQVQNTTVSCKRHMPWPRPSKGGCSPEFEISCDQGRRENLTTPRFLPNFCPRRHLNYQIHRASSTSDVSSLN